MGHAPEARRSWHYRAACPCSGKKKTDSGGDLRSMTMDRQCCWTVLRAKATLSPIWRFSRDWQFPTEGHSAVCPTIRGGADGVYGDAWRQQSRAHRVLDTVLLIASTLTVHEPVVTGPVRSYLSQRVRRPCDAPRNVRLPPSSRRLVSAPPFGKKLRASLGRVTLFLRRRKGGDGVGSGGTRSLENARPALRAVSAPLIPVKPRYESRFNLIHPEH